MEDVGLMTITNKTYKTDILIDLDGVLNNYKGIYNENEMPSIKTGAKKFLQRLYSLNKYNLILFTTRNFLKTAKWLIDNDLYIFFKDITNVKTPASIFIDDRAINFNGDYEKIYNEILNFSPHWKKRK